MNDFKRILLVVVLSVVTFTFSFAQRTDKYGYKVVKEMRVVSCRNGYTKYFRFTYGSNMELKTMTCSWLTDSEDFIHTTAYKNGELLTDKYVRNNNKIHRYKYVGGDINWKFDYNDYWLNSDGVVEKKEEWSYDSDGSGGAIRNTYEYVYRNESFTELPLIYKISEKKEARSHANSKWVDQNGGFTRIWEYDYTGGYMNYRQCNWINGKFVVEDWRRNGYILYDGYPNKDSGLFEGVGGWEYGYVYSEKVNDTNIDFFYDYRPNYECEDIYKTEWCSRRSNNLLRYVKGGDSKGNRIEEKYEYTYDESGNIVRIDVYSGYNYSTGKLDRVDRIYLDYLY